MTPAELETGLFGLYSIAKQQQTTAEAHQATAALAAASAKKSVENARGVLQAAASDLQKNAQEAIKAAVATEATSIAAPLRQASQEAMEVARATKAAVARLDWAWMAAAFFVGLAAGVVMLWVIYQKDRADQEERLSRMENTIAAIYWQTPEGKAEKAKRK